MKKVFLLPVFAFLFCFTAVAQLNEKPILLLNKTNQQFKEELVNSMQLSQAAAEKIVGIEDRFFKSLQEIGNMPGLKIKDKETLLNKAHVERRAALQSLPMTGRQMEDVVALSEEIRRRNKV